MNDHVNSLNFIVKDYNSQYAYAGCQAEKILYIIKPDQTILAHNIETVALCGALCNDLTLAIGGHGEILFYSI